MILLVLIRPLTSGILRLFVRRSLSRGVSESKISEWCAILSFLLSIALLLLSWSTSIILRWIAAIVALFLIVGVLDYLLCIVFIDRKEKHWHLKSPERSLILLFLNYVELIFAFASLYICTGSIAQSECSNPIANPFDAWYFSAATIATLAYGDVRPISFVGKFIAIAEVASGLLLIVLIVGVILQELNERPQRPRER